MADDFLVSLIMRVLQFSEREAAKGCGLVCTGLDRKREREGPKRKPMSPVLVQLRKTVIKQKQFPSLRSCCFCVSWSSLL